LKNILNIKAMRHLAALFAASAGFVAVLWLCGWLVRPDLQADLPSYSPEELAAAEKLRDNSVDPADDLQIYRAVDYSAGPQAAWYPKGESPILAELVAEGKLPPVQERVGAEPVVYEGVEGIGKYGGTWVRALTDEGSLRFYMTYELGNTTLLRFSPHGYPATPLLARSYEVSEDNAVFTFRLRKGMRWSDGHPFTADDIMFWWEGWATWKDPDTGEQLGWVPEIVKARGKEGRIEKVDEYTVRYIFPESQGIFLEFMTGGRGAAFAPKPAHYLRKYHPEYGDQALIAETMKAYKLPSKMAVFKFVDTVTNPERPSLSPWIMQTYRPSGPYTLVRNPYYCAVDTEGNQLPYLDRIHFMVKNAQMVSMAVANGETSMQVGEFVDYSLLIDQRRRNGYEVYHWYPAERSIFSIAPNHNRKVYSDRPETGFKHELLNDKRFRQALSLAIDRQKIIDVEWNGFGAPSQTAPGPASIYHHPELSHSFVDYDPEDARKRLDEIGLIQWDDEGYRTFKDGSRMVFYLNVNQATSQMGAVQFVVDDWAAVGIRVIPRERSNTLFSLEKWARKPDLILGKDSSSHNAVGGGDFMPQNGHSAWGSGWGEWYHKDGMAGSPKAKQPGNVEPPVGHPIREVMRLYDRASMVVDPFERRDLYRPALQIAAENLWTIGVATAPPVLAVVKDGLRNVPRSLVYGFIDGMLLNSAYPDTWYWDKPSYAPGERQEIKREIATITPQPPAGGVELNAEPDGSLFSTVFGGLLKGLFVVAVLLLAFKHPYVGRRLLIMVPTMAIISIITFAIIQIPPGNYLTTYIEQLKHKGEELSAGEVADLETMFYLNDPVVIQYSRWIGLKWFFTFDPADEGLLQGNLGRSMAQQKPVNDIIGDRILLTVLISLGTILFTWALAVPIGIYSAVRQYSLSDYLLTLVGFLGMCIPQFLFALVLIYWSDHYLGIKVTGLFSSQYAVQPHWDLAKFVDLLQHIWLPVLVLGVGGTAGMIRVMRANLLDEIKKPYVTTARAKGVRPLKLLLKYPVRLALNPFISGIGGLFPALISGGAIVAMVLSLPTVGPLMLDALLTEDMYLAGSLLMVLSMLGVFGVLISDLLLLWLDPRIRFEGGGR
jgi:ABC-type dipeptide/oligopeptide/nickel transport system permease component/ABC-type transport system substrate-binding protein